MSLKQRVQFLSRFITNPRKIGSVTPSSRFLVEAMLRPIPWTDVGTIVELGAGTGVLTHQVNQRMRDSCKGFVFEQDPHLRHILKQRYPRLFHCMDAKRLRNELKHHGVQQVDCIVSSLPFANFTNQERIDFINEIKRALAKDGTFVAYQYSLQMRSLFEQYFSEVSTQFIPFNLPPSFVYVCR